MRALAMGAARRRRVIGTAAGALACVLAVPAIAAGATTWTVAPGASREGPACTPATPCNYIWVLEHAVGGDTVQFESGVYAFDGAARAKDAVVSSGITLERAPGDATRPVIRQTTPFKEHFDSPMLSLEPNVTIRDLEIDQTATGVNNGAGALDAGAGDVIERTILTGGIGGMYATPKASTPIVLRDDLVVAGAGVAIQLENGTMRLENDTVIARGSESGAGIALLSRSTFSKASVIEATDTIARGQIYDAEANVESSGSGSTVALHYSDSRTAFEVAHGSPAKVEDSDHPTHGEPLFVSATDFHEAPGSPTIDAGVTDPLAGPLDLEGAQRLLGGGQDIGAYEFQPPPVQGGEAPPAPKAPAAVPAPLDGPLHLSSARFRAALRGATLSRARTPIGTVITYTDSEAATTTFTVLAATPGVRGPHGCSAPPRRRRRGNRYTRCTRQVIVGSFTHADIAGTNVLHFSGRLHGGRLKPRAYRLTATPRNSAGKPGATVSAAFVIAR